VYQYVCVVCTLCVCVCARARARACACVRVCVYVCILIHKSIHTSSIRSLIYTGLWARLPDFLIMYLPGDALKLWIYDALGRAWKAYQHGQIQLWQV
jgi:hypothetical protein